MADSLVLIERAKYALDPNLTLDKATHSFFRFSRPPMRVNNRRILEGCFFVDLHIPVYVEDWPQQPGPTHPGVFEDAFPALLNKLIARDSILTLHVKSSDPDYFDELTFIRDVLALRRMEYVLLASRLDPQYPPEIGNLLFEWPLNSLQHIVDKWFMSPQVTIEGYSSRRSCLGRLAEQFFERYCEQNIREILEALEFGFKLWPDNNGLFVVSDKLDEAAIRVRLTGPELEGTIRAAIVAARRRNHDLGV